MLFTVTRRGFQVECLDFKRPIKGNGSCPLLSSPCLASALDLPRQEGKQERCAATPQ